jgi:hypothetical protein
MPRGVKPGPRDAAKDRNARVHPWNEATAVGWQHGKMPTAPPGLSPEARKVWRTWFSSWWASFWTPEDLPGLRLAITGYCRYMTYGNSKPSDVLPMLDRYGITPKGRQDLRWLPPADHADEPAEPVLTDDELAKARARRERIS